MIFGRFCEKGDVLGDGARSDPRIRSKATPDGLVR
jgi:hypothetical protein